MCKRRAPAVFAIISLGKLGSPGYRYYSVLKAGL
ncbi:hypothetical protein NC653_003468 [Populus alba x Populus x berolinensis]|uniref:Uncharacterized protein n=1 Tax=Populus alba x Populus x berolinensis TaxID=444605 RepID=A0AAD6RRL8_9ROSI|nr:hypothetical protein NC653_003468 [Populus alba x Populus x berolinensis]